MRSLPMLVACLLPGLLSGCWQTSYGAPAWKVAQYAAMIAASRVVCAVGGCRADLPEGMTARRFAELDSTPVSIAVDYEGRVIVAEGDRMWGGAEDNRRHAYWLEDDLAARRVEDRRAYQLKWIAAGKFEREDHFTARADRILRISDEDGDGKGERSEVLAEFREPLDGLAAGVLVVGDDILATVIPHVWRLRPSRAASSAAGPVAFERQALASGFGVKTSLLGHDLHGLVRGPDGKIYFSVGDRGYSVTTKEGALLEPPLGPGRGAVFRMNPDGSGLEVFATGLRNPQELAFDDHGNLFTGDNNGDGGDEARIVYVVEGGDTGWAMPYQTRVGDYRLGPWIEERLWETQHEGQPAWIVPPIGHLANGPSGFASYPGLGLPERYRGRFFLANYAYQTSLSGILSFALEPAGAGFSVSDPDTFIGNLLATDFELASDGRLYVAAFDQFRVAQSLEVYEHAESRADPRLAEMQQLLRGGFVRLAEPRLRELLGFVDRRVRLEAQFELVRRGSARTLAAVASDSAAAELARLHALWGLGQLGAPGLRQVAWNDLGWTLDSSDELRAQVAKIAGEVGADWLVPDLLTLFEDESPRVRFFAAQSLGKLASIEATEPLYRELRTNADRDVFLRHALVLALSRIGDAKAALARMHDPDVAVRRGALLVLRRLADRRIEGFLGDPDPTIVAEAARAIYDVPIADAYRALARLAVTPGEWRAAPAQTHMAIERRIVGAALALRDEEGARLLAAYAVNGENPQSLREGAIDALGRYATPDPRDLAMSFYRPLAVLEPSVVWPAIDEFGRELSDGDLARRWLPFASQYGRVSLSNAELVAKVRDVALSADERTASLRALAGRSNASGEVEGAIAVALAARDPRVRAAARNALADRNPERAEALFRGLPDDAALAEWRGAYATLARMHSPGADALLLDAFERLALGRLRPALHLDLLEALRARGNPDLLARYERWQTSLPEDPVERKSWALDGGDPAGGLLVFQGAGDCQRCHAVGGATAAAGGGHGASVGPDLTGLAKRSTPLERLRSVLLPQAEVVPGYGTIRLVLREGTTLDGTLVDERPRALVIESAGARREVPLETIASRTAPLSPMPPNVLLLGDRELRDLMAYLGTL